MSRKDIREQKIFSSESFNFLSNLINFNQDMLIIYPLVLCSYSLQRSCNDFFFLNTII